MNSPFLQFDQSIYSFRFLCKIAKSPKRWVFGYRNLGFDMELSVIRYTKEHFAIFLYFFGLFALWTGLFAPSRFLFALAATLFALF